MLQEYASLLRDEVKLSSFPDATLVAPQAQEVYFNKFSDRRVNYSEFFPLEGPIDRATSASHVGCDDCDIKW